MTDYNWTKWGEDIINTVQSSIENKDFTKLNDEIGRIVNSAFQNVRNSTESIYHTTQTKRSSYSTTRTKQSGYNTTQASQNAYGQTGSFGTGTNSQNRSQTTVAKTGKQSLYARTGKHTAVGVLLTVFGGMGTGIFLISFLTALLTALLSEGFLLAGGIATSVIMGIFLAGSAIMLTGGVRKLTFVSRFKNYVKLLGDKVSYSIPTLAKKMGKSEHALIKDLSKMIQKRFFLQGHLEEEQKYLITSDEYFTQFQQAKQQYLIREQERKRLEAENENKMGKLPENVRQIISEGEAFIKKIHASNDAIPGEEISQKIDYMERIVKKIFQRIEEKPELVSEVKKLMSYYLPTTVKLLDVYEELDAQPIQGPNITASKLEIEKTMDTLNAAFEKMLDDFYQATAWDVSSDISVLETMLAQEGLTKSGFEKTTQADVIK